MEQDTEQKVFKYLALALSLVAVLILVKVIFFTPSAPPSVLPLEPKEVRINFKVLENPALKELIPLEEITLPKEVGRENPFAAY